MGRRVAVAQMNSSSSVEHNLRQAIDLISQARLSGASFVCLPEALDFIVQDPSHAMSLASSIHTNPLLSRYHSISSQYDLWLSLGGMSIFAPENPSRLYNVHMVLSPYDTSTPVATYRKLHINNEPQATLPSESDTTLGGNSLVVAYDTPLGNVGLTVGHDLYFPSLFESLRESNAHVILTPSAMPVSRGRAHWHTLLRSRAIESQCYIVGAAQTGIHSSQSESFGHSLVVSPFGDQIIDAGGDGIGLVCADINLDFIYQVRERMPLRKQRRDDVFGKVISANPHTI